MTRVRHVGSGAFVASLAAGPLLVAAMLLGQTFDGRPMTLSGDGAALAGVLPVVVIGWAFAIVPNLVGAGVLGALASGNVGLRLPVMWALVGAAAAGAPTWLCWPPGDNAGAAAAMAAVGAGCALVCRARVRWTDASD